MRLHLILDGYEAETPDEWLISRVCEEFGCLPSQAREALENDRNGELFVIMQLRSYARNKTRWDAAQGDGDAMNKMRNELMTEKGMQDVIENEFELVKMRHRGEL